MNWWRYAVDYFPLSRSFALVLAFSKSRLVAFAWMMKAMISER